MRSSGRKNCKYKFSNPAHGDVRASQRKDRTTEGKRNAYLKHKNGSKDYHHDGVTCCEDAHGFDTVLPCIDIYRSDNGSEGWNCYCKVDSYSKNICR